MSVMILLLIKPVLLSHPGLEVAGPSQPEPGPPGCFAYPISSLVQRCNPLKWAKLTAALFIYDLLVILKCIQWSGLTCCSRDETSRFSKRTSKWLFSYLLLINKRRGQRSIMAGLAWPLCQVTEIMAATSSQRTVSLCISLFLSLCVFFSISFFVCLFLSIFPSISLAFPQKSKGFFAPVTCESYSITRHEDISSQIFVQPQT